MASNSIDPEVSRFLEDPEREIEQPYARTEHFLLKYLAHCLRRIDSQPAVGRSLVLVAQKVLMPRIVHVPCLTVQALALLSGGERLLGNLDLAEMLVGLAFELAGDCQRCHAHLHRKRALIRMDQKRFHHALSSSDTAIEFYQTIETDEVHELYGHGLATAYLWRGVVYYEAALNDRHAKASSISHSVDDIGKSLSLVSARQHPFVYRKAIVNLGYALAETGNEEDLKLADRHIHEARRLFQGVTEISQERAKLDWLTGMVRHRLRSMRPCRVQECLKNAQFAFIHLGMPQETVAVTTDLCRIVFPDQNRIRDLVTGVENNLTRLSLELRQKIRSVVDATNLEDWNAPRDRILRESLEALRKACGPKMLSCLIAWPASM